MMKDQIENKIASLLQSVEVDMDRQDSSKKDFLTVNVFTGNTFYQNFHINKSGKDDEGA
jgi:hypothetical protein